MSAPDARTARTAFAVVTSLFFMWGFVTVLVDALVPRLREVFELTLAQAGRLQTAFFLAYGVVSVPAGFLLARIGYKRGMLLGLCTMGLGCLLFWPAAGYREFALFLLGNFILAAGMTVLQVAANPYVAVLGEERGASSRLNLAQAFNSLGTTIAPILGAQFILSDRILSSEAIQALPGADRTIYLEGEAYAVQGPFVVLALALLLLAGIVAVSKLPRILGERIKGGYAEALRNPRLLPGAVGIFLYVGAEVGIGTYLVNYFLSMDMDSAVRGNALLGRLAGALLNKDLDTVDAKGVVGAFGALYWGGAMVGRFVGSYLTLRYRPQRVLLAFGLAVIGLLVTTMLTTGFVAMFSILAVGLFNSIMFPTIFTLAMAGMGELKPQASGILCTAIMGGAFIPPLLGGLADGYGFKAAFVLLLFCYGYIVFYARRTSSSST